MKQRLHELMKPVIQKEKEEQLRRQEQAKKGTFANAFLRLDNEQQVKEYEKELYFMYGKVLSRPLLLQSS